MGGVIEVSKNFRHTQKKSQKLDFSAIPLDILFQKLSKIIQNFVENISPLPRNEFLSHIRSNDLLRRTFRAFGAPANF